MTEQEVSQTIEALARDTFGAGKFRAPIVNAGYDQDGDAILSVMLLAENQEAMSDSRKLLRFMLAAREKLESAGELRFPVISFGLAAEYDKYAAA